MAESYLGRNDLFVVRFFEQHKKAKLHNFDPSIDLDYEIEVRAFLTKKKILKKIEYIAQQKTYTWLYDMDLKIHPLTLGNLNNRQVTYHKPRFIEGVHSMFFREYTERLN